MTEGQNDSPGRLAVFIDGLYKKNYLYSIADGIVVSDEE